MGERFVKLCAICVAIFIVSSFAIVLIYRFAPVRYTPLMFIRKQEAFHRGERLELHHDWVPFNQISPDLVCAVVESEDAHFYEHGGFSYSGMLNAFYRNKREGRIVAGGSTISQQTAKNVFCTPSRTYSRKLLEAYFTMLIELLWGKERILEVYFNVIELGDGIFGVESAAQYYYGTSAMYVSYRQAQSLSEIIPCPLYYFPSEAYVWK